MSAILPASPDANQPQSPAQRKFNQLQRKIEAARAALAAWDQALPEFSAAHAARVAPLQAEWLRVCEQLMRQLGVLLDGQGFTKAERALLNEVATCVATKVLGEGMLSAAQQTQWQTWHDLHAPQDLATLEREQMASMRDAMAAYAGLDLDDVPLGDPEDLLREVHERLQQRAEQEQAQAQAQRRPTAAQRKREAAAAAAQEQARQSLREVFRKLASALHPDRAEDAADQTRRTGLMQRVNEAYGRADLLALYALQLEIEQVDEAHFAKATTAQLKHFIQVLQEQLDELNAELRSRSARLCFDYRLQPRQEPKPDKLGRVLNEAVAELRVVIYDASRDLRQLQDPKTAKPWLRRFREEQLQAELMQVFRRF